MHRRSAAPITGVIVVVPDRPVPASSGEFSIGHRDPVGVRSTDSTPRTMRPGL